MFQPQPAAAQRRHRRMPSGTMVSYAEVKNYLSKREIPQLFESLMAGLMYHRPENHIGYLQTCLDEVKSNAETKVHWSTFVNKKRKSKEILPPLTPPKKQEPSFSPSWSDNNSRQSTPLPPISAKTRTKNSKDLRNTYILYHNPPPVLAKPRVPVVSVLGGLGSRIDQLCEKVVGRLGGVVHISTCSMLKTRMTIEGFYRMTSVPACAVVDSVLQAMSMVQSASALLVAGFPRNRGDIEEYRSRRVRMDGVVLVDFEEEALRRFLKNEVSSGAIRTADVESELERYKQDIISVAEYYDEKDILTVVMGDQDTDEMIEDMVLAVDKIIETRKNVQDEYSAMDVVAGHECEDSDACKSLVPSPNGVERPSTVEIRDATEEDIKSIEAASRNSEECVKPEESDMKNSNEDINSKVPDSIVSKEDIETMESGLITSNEDIEVTGVDGDEDVPEVNANATEDLKPDCEDSSAKLTVDQETAEETETHKDNSSVHEKPSVPILFSFENIKTDCEILKDLIVNEMGMCYINFCELVRSDGDKDDRLDTNESLNLLENVLQRDSVSYASGFFISDFPFDLLNESKFENILKLGDVSFVCKVREKSFETEINEKCQKEDLLFQSPMNEHVRILFVTESNIIDELKASLQEILLKKEYLVDNNEKPSDTEKGPEITKLTYEMELIEATDSIDNKEVLEENDEQNPKEITNEENSSVIKENEGSSIELNKLTNDEPKNGKEQENEESVKEDDDLTSRDENEESTCQDVEDIKTDDTLDEAMKPLDVSPTEESDDINIKEMEMENTLSQISEPGMISLDIPKDKPVLERQQNLDIETTSTSASTTQLAKDPELRNKRAGNEESDLEKDDQIKLIRQETFVSSHGTIPEAEEPENDLEDTKEIIKTNSEDVDNQEQNGEFKCTESTLENRQADAIEKESNDEAEPLPGETDVRQEDSDKEIIEEESNAVVAEDEAEVEKNNTNDMNSSGESKEQTEKEVGPIENGNKPLNEDSEPPETSISEKDDPESAPEEIVGEKSTKTENSEANENGEETVDAEIQEASEDIEESSGQKVPDENREISTSNDSDVDSQRKAETDETSTDGDSENSQIEIPKRDATNEKEENVDEQLIDSEIPSEEKNEKEDCTSNPVESKELDGNTGEENKEEKTNEVDDEHTEEQKTAGDTSTKILKALDNDSDSYDETVDKSITIETHAEVHAPDSESPPLIQETKDYPDTQSIQEKNNIEETQTLQKVEESNQETGGDEGTAQTEEQNVEDSEEICQLLIENSPAIAENDDYIIVDTDAIQEENDLLDFEIEESRLIRETTYETTTEESQVTTIQEVNIITNERFSAKIQERNGSGILGDKDDHSGTDEPQERSSSSSRGEL